MSNSAKSSFFKPIYTLSLWTSYKKTYLTCFLFLALAAFSFIKWQKATAKEDEFITARSTYERWIKGSKEDLETFKKLHGLLKKHPELKPLYQFSIIQECLAANKLDLAELLIKELQKKNGDYFSRFSEISMLMERGDLQGALEETLLLKEDLLAEERQIAKEHSALFFHNLIRAGFLSARLEKKESELLCWKQLKKYSERDLAGETMPMPFDSKAYEALMDQFSDQNLSINDYIKHREKLLSLRD